MSGEMWLQASIVYTVIGKAWMAANDPCLLFGEHSCCWQPALSYCSCKLWGCAGTSVQSYLLTAQMWTVNKVYCLEFFILTLWHLPWSTCMFFFYKSLILFMLATNFTHSWQNQHLLPYWVTKLKEYCNPFYYFNWQLKPCFD